MRPLMIVAMLALSNALAGCLGADVAPSATVSESFVAPVETDAKHSVLRIHRPAWVQGQWWEGQLALDLDWGSPLTDAGRFVAVVNGTGWTVGTASEGLSVLDTYFDTLLVGPLDEDLNPISGGRRVELFRWPLEPNATWETQVPMADGRGGAPGLVPARVRVTTLDDPGSFAPRLRMLAQLPHGLVLDYDLSARTGWFTYVRLRNETTGQVFVSAELRSWGSGHVGDVHAMERTPLFERVVAGLLCDEQGQCGYLGVPPHDRFEVGAGFTFVEEIRFLFTFAIEGAGGGHAAVVNARPDGTVRNVTHAGAVDPFTFRFDREAVRSGFTGEWTAGFEATGFAGVYFGVHGFRDRVVRL